MISSHETSDVYIGITEQTLKLRFGRHKRHYTAYCNDKYGYCSSFQVVCYEDAKIQQIDESDDSEREKYWIRKLDCCNFICNKKPEDYIYKHKAKDCKQGFIYRFYYRHNGKNIQKVSINYDKLLDWVLKWFEENNVLFD